MLKDMYTMTRIYALDERRRIVILGRGIVEHKVNTSLVKRDRVHRSEDAHVVHLGVGRRVVTVAVNREVVHHIDVDDTTLEIVMNRLRCHSHTLDELVLLGSMLPNLLLLGNNARRVDISLAVCRSYTNRLVL